MDGGQVVALEQPAEQGLGRGAVAGWVAAGGAEEFPQGGDRRVAGEGLQLMLLAGALGDEGAELGELVPGPIA